MCHLNTNMSWKLCAQGKDTPDGQLSIVLYSYGFRLEIFVMQCASHKQAVNCIENHNLIRSTFVCSWKQHLKLDVDNMYCTTIIPISRPGSGSNRNLPSKPTPVNIQKCGIAFKIVVIIIPQLFHQIGGQYAVV